MNISYDQLENSLPTLKREFVGKHINKLICFCNNVFSFSLCGEKIGIFSLRNGNPYIGYARSKFHYVSMPNPNIQFLKKELSNFLIQDILLKSDDRILEFLIEGTNDVFEDESKWLVFELFPSKPNMFILNSNRQIIFSLKESSDGRINFRNSVYTYPNCSPFKRTINTQTIDYLKLFDELCEVRKKEKYEQIFSYLHKRIQTSSSKVEKIKNDLENATRHINDGDYGNLILMHLNDIKYKDKILIVDDIHIPLDPRLKPYENANAYFKRAKKAKATIEQSDKNLLRAQEEITNLSSIYNSLLDSDEETCDKIISEFKLNDLTKKKAEEASSSISHSNHPYIAIYNNTTIVFGKNAIQNDYLTFIYDTSKKHQWMHIIGMPGSHLMIKSDKPSDDVISMCAQILCYNSKQPDGSVMLTNRENVFKGNAPGEVIVKTFKTIRVNSVSKEAVEIVNSAKKL